MKTLPNGSNEKIPASLVGRNRFDVLREFGYAGLDITAFKTKYGEEGLTILRWLWPQIFTRSYDATLEEVQEFHARLETDEEKNRNLDAFLMMIDQEESNARIPVLEKETDDFSQATALLERANTLAADPAYQKAYAEYIRQKAQQIEAYYKALSKTNIPHELAKQLVLAEEQSKTVAMLGAANMGGAIEMMIRNFTGHR